MAKVRKECNGNDTGNGCGKDGFGARLTKELKKPRTKEGRISSLLEELARRSVNIGRINKTN